MMYRDVLLKQLPIRNLLHQRAIGVEKVELGQLAPVDPANIAEDTILQFAIVLFHDKKLQVDGIAVVIAVLELRDLLADGGAHTKLFVEFASQRIRRGLSSFDLAAG